MHRPRCADQELENCSHTSRWRSLQDLAQEFDLELSRWLVDMEGPIRESSRMLEVLSLHSSQLLNGHNILQA